MTIAPAAIDLLAVTLSEASPATSAGLRAALGGTPVILMAADHLADETPYRVLPGFDVHLFDGSAHCPRLTRDLGCATGLIVTRQP